MCRCARDTGSQGVGSRDTGDGLMSAKEQLLPNRLHVFGCLVFDFQTSGVRVVEMVVFAVE